MPITLNFTGTRITDAIAGILTTSLAAYNALTPGQATEVTAAEYDALMALSGAGKFGTTDVTMAGNPPNGGITAGYTSALGAPLFNGPYFSASRYMVAFSIKPKATTTANNFQNLKVKFAAGSFTTGLNDFAHVISNTPAPALTQKYFVVKAPQTATPNDPRIGFFLPSGPGNANDLIGMGGTNVTAYYQNNVAGDVTNITATASARGGPAYFQAIMTPTKQW